MSSNENEPKFFDYQIFGSFEEVSFEELSEIEPLNIYASWSGS